MSLQDTINSIAASRDEWAARAQKAEAELARIKATWIETDDRGPLASLGAEAHANARAKGFYDPPPSIVERLCLIHSEVSEALEAHRDGHDAFLIVDGKPEGVPSELADIVIRVVDMATYLDVDLDKAVRLKMNYNATRPHKHGRKL